MPRYPRMSTADRDRCEEAEAERYNTLYETVHVRMTREFYETGGTGDYKPDSAKVHSEVVRIMDREEKANQE